MAIGKVRQTSESYSKNVRTITFHCVGGTGGEAGQIPITPIEERFLSPIQGWYLDSVEIVPGTPGPTTLGNLFVLDEYDLDVLGGNGVNLFHATNTLGTVPSIDGQNKRIPIRRNLWLSVTGVVVESAQYRVLLNCGQYL